MIQRAQWGTLQEQEPGYSKEQMGEIRPHQQGDGLHLARFFDRYFPVPEGRVVTRSRSPEYFDWKYGPNPFGEPIAHHYWHDGELLATFGAYARMASIRGERAVVYEHCQSFVAPSMQGKGLYRKLAQTIFDEIDRRSEIAYGIAPEARNMAILVKQYDHVQTLTYGPAVGPVHLAELARVKGLAMPASLDRLAHVVRGWFFNASSIEIEEIAEPDTSFCVEPADDADFEIVKDPEYLGFRYVRCPEPYRFFVARDSAHAVLLVVKLCSWGSMQVCYLIDVVGRLEEHVRVPFLCIALYAIGYRTGAALASLMVIYCAQYRWQTMRTGFVPRKKVEYFFMRQNKWPFLNPVSQEYDCRKWTYVPGDSDFF